MRVLILRPEQTAARTARKLAALGHETARLPLSRPQHDLDAVKAALAERHSAIAITSAEVARLFGHLGDTLDRHLLTTVFSVGQASANAASAAGFRTVLTPGGNGKDLADMIVAHCRDFGMPAEPILYLAGVPRARGFEMRLTEAGIPLRTVEAYRMVPVVPRRTETETALLKPVPDAVLFYSGESARAFFKLSPLVEIPERFLSTLMLCMSANVAKAVPQRFAASTVVASAPNEESLLDLL
ncbi:uroporphyrinogen-III synthase [Shinella yambaruensis]|uniref:Uroporphyrinogen-III synthase n=1 Tax=Shinella yambaruensis TaxID=415996 RepID=A0ABQ5Z860_9HYPH|nr:uroporphyrinogen-III synthase [Shinella yambaruensis]MCJ8027969.1 uroporphyrinogen-III synthase [Shinella yambaruensis]MCU7980039.1 uroporphyrinogen-III synthase [Shinella yambaruensis]GLR48985.1 uroporphyrinogen III methyltransferase [Shinella yambaruensis]